MTFERAVLSALRNYVTFEGRAPQSEFWWFQLFCGLIYVAMICIGTLISDGGAAVLLVLLAWFGLLLPWLALGVRRLHDAGLSGAWMFLLLVPSGGLTWLAVMVMCSLASDRANQFGPPPAPRREVEGDVSPSVPPVRRRK